MKSLYANVQIYGKHPNIGYYLKSHSSCNEAFKKLNNDKSIQILPNQTAIKIKIFASTAKCVIDADVSFKLPPKQKEATVEHYWNI